MVRPLQSLLSIYFVTIQDYTPTGHLLPSLPALPNRPSYLQTLLLPPRYLTLVKIHVPYATYHFSLLKYGPGEILLPHSSPFTMHLLCSRLWPWCWGYMVLDKVEMVSASYSLEPIGKTAITIKL